MQDKKFFCIEPFVSLSIVRDNHIFPCCLNEGQQATNTDDLWNDPYLKDIRKKVLNGEIPKGCEACVQQEKLGGLSRRQHSNEVWLSEHGNFEDVLNNDAPYKLDFWTGNLCNLACSTCNYKNSSTWFSLLNKANKAGKTDLIHKGNLSWNLDYSYEYKKEDIPNIDFKNMLFLHFNGGEPLNTDSHLKILNLIPEERRKDVFVLYNTNGTVRVDLSEEKWKIFRDFRSVDLCFSLDGIRDTFEYIRWPAKWETVRSNIDWWHQYCYQKYEGRFYQMSFNVVKTTYNYKEFDDIIKFIQNRWIRKIIDSTTHREKPEYSQFIFTTNDHDYMGWTDEQFDEYVNSDKFKEEKNNLEILRNSDK